MSILEVCVPVKNFGFLISVLRYADVIDGGSGYNLKHIFGELVPKDNALSNIDVY
jgi:hypothetical protein